MAMITTSLGDAKRELQLAEVSLAAIQERVEDDSRRLSWLIEQVELHLGEVEEALGRLKDTGA